jgi:hypothetical protein
MMNCLSSIPGRGRYSPRIFDSQDNDDDSVEEFYRAHTFILGKEKARKMESALGNAITIAENSSGGLFCLHHMTKKSAVELGRQISTCPSMRNNEETEAEQKSANDVLATDPLSCSFQRAISRPTFLKVELGNPDVSTQKSMNTISLADSVSEDDDCGIHSERKAAPVVVTPPRRNFGNKLRLSLSKEERFEKQLQQQQSKCGTGRFSTGHMNLTSRKSSDPFKNMAKRSVVEVSSSSENKKGWGRQLRRCNKNEPSEVVQNTTTEFPNPVQESLPLTPTTLMDMEVSQQSESEDFFLNDHSLSEDVAMTMEAQKLHEAPDTMEESMEVVNQGSCFDIIGTSTILNGLETSWKDLSEDSFDVVPRRH